MSSGNGQGAEEKSLLPESYVTEIMPQAPGSFIFEYVKRQFFLTDSYAPYHVYIALSTLASVVHPALAVGYAGRVVRPTFWSLLVGAAGNERKSTCVDMGMDALKTISRERLFAQPESQGALIEMLADRAKDHPMKVAQGMIAYPEFAAFLSQSKDRGYLAPVKMKFLDLWGCGPLERAVVKKKPITVDLPLVNLTAAVETTLLESETGPLDWSGGFLSRWAIVFGAKERYYPAVTGMHKESFDRICDLLRDRATCPVVGECLGFTPEAKAVWESWSKNVDDYAKTAGRAASVAARVPTLAIKTAMLFAYDLGDARTGTPWYITYDVLRPAINLTVLHLQSVKHLMQRICDNKDQRDMQIVTDAVPKEGATLGDILRGTRMMKKRAKEILETLKEMDTIKTQTVANKLTYFPSWAELPEGSTGDTGPMVDMEGNVINPTSIN